jgi:protoporphyrinogen/coproporphyrinogen III oxidase
MIVIIGGGISGLALAHQLAERGRPFVLLEASARVGGVIRSGRVEGHLLEWGPQRGRLTREFAGLVDDLGHPRPAHHGPAGLPLYVYRNGRLRRVPFSVGEFLRSDILSWRGKLRLLLEPFTAAARDDEAVADFFVRKIGAKPTRTWPDPCMAACTRPTLSRWSSACRCDTCSASSMSAAA